MSDETNSTEQSNDEPVTEKKELPGKRLRQAREDRRMTPDEVASHLHLDVKLITALEEDDYEQLPAPSYICGYLRSYARLLKLPESEIVESYTQGQQISADLLPKNVTIASRAKPASKTTHSPVVIVLVILVIAAVAFLIFELTTGQNGEQQQSDEMEAIPLTPQEQSGQSSTEIIPYTDDVAGELSDGGMTIEPLEPSEITQFKKTNPAAEEQAPEEKVAVQKKSVESKQQPSIRLVYSADSWTEVVDGSGEKLLYRLVGKGSDLAFKGKTPFTVLLGNAAAVKVYYQGKEFDHTRFQRDQIAYFKLGASE